MGVATDTQPAWRFWVTFDRRGAWRESQPRLRKHPRGWRRAGRGGECGTATGGWGVRELRGARVCGGAGGSDGLKQEIRSRHAWFGILNLVVVHHRRWRGWAVHARGARARARACADAPLSGASDRPRLSVTCAMRGAGITRGSLITCGCAARPRACAARVAVVEDQFRSVCVVTGTMCLTFITA